MVRLPRERQLRRPPRLRHPRRQLLHGDHTRAVILPAGELRVFFKCHFIELSSLYRPTSTDLLTQRGHDVLFHIFSQQISQKNTSFL